MLQYELHSGVLVLHLCEHLLRGYILSCLGLFGLVNYFQLAEQYVAHLLGRGYIEVLARLGVYFLLYALYAFAE